MKTAIFICLFFCLSWQCAGQSPVSGTYENGLYLAYDSSSKKLTGYFENYTGWDEQTKHPRFSCIFYIEGVVTGNKFNILTYYPEDKNEDTILGYMELMPSGKVKIFLPQEHGGCWNVQHFADEPVVFPLQTQDTWKRIHYVQVPKTYFYSERSIKKRSKKYLVKNDFVCIVKTVGEWVYCVYYGNKTTQGWINTADLNKL